MLLIEDDPMVQQVNRLFIEKVDGFRVVGAAANGKEGRAKVAELRPHLVLLDVFMPEEDGVTALGELRKGAYDVDVIAVTAANDTETVKKILRQGVVDYIVKPFTFDRLQQALMQYKHLHQRLEQQETVSQTRLDEVRLPHEGAHTPKKTNRQTLPKGIQRHTLEQIVQYMQRVQEAQSAEEIGDAVGLARVTVRRYLQYLEEANAVTVQLHYGTIGRPVQRYRYVSEDSKPLTREAPVGSDPATSETPEGDTQ